MEYNGGGVKNKYHRDLNLQKKNQSKKESVRDNQKESVRDSQKESIRDNQKESIDENQYSYYEESNEEGNSIENDRDNENDRDAQNRSKNNDRRFNNLYKPGSEKQGKLITTNVTSYKAIDGKSSPNYHSSLQKMNKLSTILMSKSQEHVNKNDAYQVDRKMDSKQLKGMIDKSKTGGKSKFISITMAMLSSKGITYF